MKDNHRDVGFHYEDLACEYLKEQGYTIIERNYHNRFGEIDIIAREGDYLVFVEVKYRSDDSYGYPEEFVNYRKQRKIIKTAEYYLMKARAPLDVLCRFDIVGIVGEEIRLVRDGFALN